jgi:drug/metabolite transporter (DMT)-like permease
MGAALGLLASLLWGAADYGGGVSTRKHPAIWVIVASQLAALLALLVGCVVCVLTVGLDAPPRAFVFGAVAGFVGVLALGAFYTALSTGTMGVVAPIASTGVVVPVVVSIASGERPSAVQVAGILVAAAGVVLATGPELGAEGAEAGRRSVLLAGLAGLGFGTVALCVARGSEGSLLTTLTVQRAVSIALAGAIAFVRFPADRPPLRSMPMLAAVGLGDGGANAAYAAATRSSLVSVASVMSSLYPAVTTLMAWRIDHERLRRIQVVGVLLALVGVLLLAAG